MAIGLALTLGRLVVGLVVGFFGGAACYVYFVDRKAAVDEVLKSVQPIGRVSKAGGGYVSVFVDRDLANYPEPGRRIFVGGKS